MFSTECKIFNLFWKNLKLLSNFLGRNEGNSYQIQNILKKYGSFTIDVYYSAKHHGINKSYCVTLKLGNQQTMVVGLKFILL